MGGQDRYRKIGTLGHGAGGEVLLVEDRLQGGHRVALKRLADDMDELAHGALEREFSTLASLSLPGVARVFDFGVFEDSELGPAGAFFTRTFVEGRSLDVVASERSPMERVRLFARVAERVRTLHAAGVVHGDLKPANIIVDPDDRAHLIDFGLACGLGSGGDRATVSGTPAFMAPELFHRVQPSARSDVYALGCTLWMLLTGSPPFGLARRAQVAKGASDCPAIPETADAFTIAVLDVCKGALCRDAHDRFPTVGELLAALERVASFESLANVDWIPPRPRGHESFADNLRAELSALGARGGSVLLSGAAGSGKTTLLRSAKWHCQLRGWHVIELPIRAGEGLAPTKSLLEQAELLSGSAATETATKDGPTQVAEHCVTQLAMIGSTRPILVIADDLDQAEGVVGELLRLVVRNERGIPIVVLASAHELSATAARELCADRTLAAPTLEPSAIRALTSDALGPIDDSVMHALSQQARGLPGVLLSALRSLSVLVAPTVADVTALDVNGLAAEHASREARDLTALEQQVIALIDVLDVSVTLPSIVTWLDAQAPATERALDRLLERGFLRRERAGFRIANARVSNAVRDQLRPEGLANLARGWLASAGVLSLSAVAHTRLALAARDATQVADRIDAVIGTLCETRSYYAAIEILREWSELAEGSAQRAAWSTLAELQHEAGELDHAAATGRRVLADRNATLHQQAQAAVLVARGLSTRGEFDAALSVLDDVPTRAAPPSLARAFRERAKIHLLRGNYRDVAVDAQRGLDIAEPTDLVRVELLTSLGMAASYLGDQANANARYEQALGLARAAGSSRDVADALAYLAIASQRGGDVRRARDLFAESLVIARELGDVGRMSNFSLNVGAMEFYLGDVGAAAEHYASAIKLAQRAGRARTALQARNNLAHVHIYFGLFEQARVESEAVVKAAADAGLRMIQAQATVLLADLHARVGELDAALVKYDEALRTYGELGQPREVADVHLDAAEAILDRGGPADPSAAAARLAAARALIVEHELNDYQLRLSLLRCRAQIGSGECERALSELQSVIVEAREMGARDVLWSAHVAAAHAHEALGTMVRARRCDQDAVEVLEDIALQVPREHREAFWNDPRRREARRRAATSISDHSVGASADTRRDRLLEIIKRLASEHDLDRLLERITESAVELSGAERGFVLLVNAAGKLEMKTERTADEHQVDPHAAFSRSVAEAVLIDGEPIVTVDASSDQRVNEYMSVHRLMLRSLACLPIRGRRGTVGVLYLEHRRHRGRFSDADIDLLHAFADQAAIALENARLMADDAIRRRELEAANVALEQAKREMESLLVARTEELERTRLALEDARVAPPLDVNRHGMIGRSAGMRRVFETIDRLCNNDVPVTILGESGTGKELVARAIHRAGTRAHGPFVVVNCAAIPEALIESELFGHVRGAFTGADRDKQGLVARASGGTLFLDEVSEMPPKMQVDFLRVVQERTIRPVGSEQDLAIDVRFVAASNRPLDDLIASKRFREDLYYRLNVVQVRVPPLRERRDDIPLLSEHFLRSFSKRDGKPPKRLSTEAIERLCAHPLPGNVRQLEHLLLNAWVLVDGTVIRAEHLALDRTSEPTPSRPPVESPETQPPAANVEEHREQERRKILESLERHAWNRVQAAAALGMPRRTFYRRLRDYSIL